MSEKPSSFALILWDPGTKEELAVIIIKKVIFYTKAHCGYSKKGKIQLHRPNL